MPYDTVRYLAFQYRKWEKYAKELKEPNVNDSVVIRWNDIVKDKYRQEYMAHLEKIDNVCYERCNYQCKGIGYCDLTCEQIEDILENNKKKGLEGLL